MKNGHDSTRLIDRALQRLLPDVFFHPIWTRLIEDGALLSREQVQSLLDSVDRLLSAGELDDACQTLFVCAFQQLRSSDHAAASNSIRRIDRLAEQHELPQVAACAAWGAAAIRLQQGEFQQAAEHLEHLQSMLGQQHEWVLSDLIDVLRQTLLSQTQVEVTARQPLSSDAVLSSAFEQLLHWGNPYAVGGINYDDLVDDGYAGRPTLALSDYTGFTWRSLWQRIKRVAKGELRLKWVEADGSDPQPRLEQLDAVISASPLAVTTLTSTLTSPSLDQPTISVQDQELATPQPLVTEQPEPAVKSPVLPSITAYLLGMFNFTVNDETVQTWPTGKGRAVFKYMLAHHEQPIPRDVLMDVFWPQAGPDAARNCLNVALHGLRQALKTVTDMPVILFEEGAYCINPEFHIWTDVDEFDHHVQAGRRFEAKDQPIRAISEYEAAVELYQGDFLSGDLYEEWPVLTRERLRVTYLEILDHLSQIYFDRKQYAACITTCQQMLARDNCREDAHCYLMRCYCRQGQHHLALRQYQTCVEALRSELKVDPAPATRQLYERIRRREHV